MKHFLTILLLAATTLAFGAEKICTTYAHATLGETTRGELMTYYFKNGDYKTSLLTSSESSQTYHGDFVVDSLHFHTFVAEFYNDTVYRITFFESSLNSDNTQLYADFLRREKIKYKDLTAVDTSSFIQAIPEEERHIVWRTDGVSEVTVFDRGYEVSFEVHNKRLSSLAFYKSMENILNTPNNDPKNKVTGVAGLQFGDTKVKIENKLYGKWQKIVVDEHSTMYNDVSVGGCLYNNFVLYYKYDETQKTQVLVSANLQKRFRTWQDKEAKEFYEMVCNIYKNKYSNFNVVKNEDEYKLAVCGMYTQDYKNGEYPPIFITYEKSLSKGGDWYYFIVVNYFGMNVDNLYDDEI